MSTWLDGYEITSTYKFRYTTLPCDDVVKKLSTSIRGHRWAPSDQARKDPNLFREEIEQNTGPHGFMLSSIIDHGYKFRHLNAASEYKPSFRFTLGNPLMAECIQKIDSSAGLYMPLEMLVEEAPLQITYQSSGRVEESIGTVVSYMLPSSLIAAREKASRMTEEEYACLLRAATNLDSMFETLIEYICSTSDAPRANLPAASSSDGLSSSITMDTLEDPTLALDWVEPDTSRSTSTCTMLRIPEEIEAAESKGADHGSPIAQMGSVLKEHALRRHAKKKDRARPRMPD